MNHVLQDLDDPYEALPASIKAVYSHEQYLWLTDTEKANLIRNETEPEVG